MILFYIVVLAAPVLIIGVRNSVSKFGEAYWQALLFLEVMNIYDSVVIDKLNLKMCRSYRFDGRC